MGKKKVARRSKVKPFIKVVNYSHLLPTRYQLELESLKGSVSAETFKEPTQRSDSKKAIKKAFEERYAKGQNRWCMLDFTWVYEGLAGFEVCGAIGRRGAGGGEEGYGRGVAVRKTVCTAQLSSGAYALAMPAPYRAVHPDRSVGRRDGRKTLDRGRRKRISLTYSLHQTPLLSSSFIPIPPIFRSIARTIDHVFLSDGRTMSWDASGLGILGSECRVFSRFIGHNEL
jgi:hypothetical protein